MMCTEDKAKHFVKDQTNFSGVTTKSTDHVSIATRVCQSFEKNA